MGPSHGELWEKSRSTCFCAQLDPGWPTYATPELARSPDLEVKMVCSLQSILLSSIDALESSLNPDRLAYWFMILKRFNEKLPRELRWATTEHSYKLTSLLI